MLLLHFATEYIKTDLEASLGGPEVEDREVIPLQIGGQKRF
jgi:hypothetical protein